MHAGEWRMSDRTGDHDQSPPPPPPLLCPEFHAQVSSLVASRRPVVVKEEAHLNIFMKMEISGRIHEADSGR